MKSLLHSTKLLQMDETLLPSFFHVIIMMFQVQKFIPNFQNYLSFGQGDFTVTFIEKELTRRFERRATFTTVPESLPTWPFKIASVAPLEEQRGWPCTMVEESDGEK